MVPLKDNSTLAEGRSSFLKSSNFLPKQRYTVNHEAGSPAAVSVRQKRIQVRRISEPGFTGPDRSLEVTSIPGMQLIECLSF